MVDSLSLASVDGLNPRPTYNQSRQPRTAGGVLTLSVHNASERFTLQTLPPSFRYVLGGVVTLSCATCNAPRSLTVAASRPYVGRFRRCLLHAVPLSVQRPWGRLCIACKRVALLSSFKERRTTVVALWAQRYDLLFCFSKHSDKKNRFFFGFPVLARVSEA